jgi:hypothetical protein
VSQAIHLLEECYVGLATNFLVVVLCDDAQSEERELTLIAVVNSPAGKRQSRGQKGEEKEKEKEKERAEGMAKR